MPSKITKAIYSLPKYTNKNKISSTHCLDDETSKVLAWSTHRGFYKVHRIPFGARPNSSTFQAHWHNSRLSNQKFRNSLDKLQNSGLK